MQAILATTVPFFALVLAGWLAARHRLLPEGAVPGLNAYVLFFALPCLLFRFGMGTPVLQLLNPWVLALYLSCQAVVVAVAMAAARRAGRGLKDAAFGALVAAFPNSGFMGVPMLAALLGPAAAGPVICTLLADLFVTSSLCIALSQLQGAGQHSARDAALRALRGALSNPLPWAIGLGALAGWASQHGLGLPGPVARGLGMLADSASPVALFTVGAMLWVSRPSAGRADWADVGTVAAVKLLLHPALVWVAATSAQRLLGAPLDDRQVVALVLAAALPSASNVSLLTERYGADSGRVARIILVSTVAALPSFSGLAWLFGVRPG